jgi:transposase
MIQKPAFEQLRTQAIALRRAGKSRREIREVLNIRSNTTLNDALRGEPPPLWTQRPRAKDDVHAQAREMRARGQTYDEIATQLGVSRSSVSIWTRDLPRVGHISYEGIPKGNADGAAMTNSLRRGQLEQQAVALRRAGKSRREIKQILGLGNSTLDRVLRGVPPPQWTRRPKAKDDLHAKARELRARGYTYVEIATELGVSRSSVSLWVRDMPRAGRLSHAEISARKAEGAARYWASEGLRREARRQAIKAAAASEIGSLSGRELLIGGALAYWCEGSKSKPYRRDDRVTFINSDPGLIRFFMRFLAATGTSSDRLTCSLQIHESADVAAAQRFWERVTGLDPAQFRRPTIKRHNPKTVRKNTGADYHGCLAIHVLRGADLYRRIEGWAGATMADPGE